MLYEAFPMAFLTEQVGIYSSGQNESIAEWG
jgi:fructose-1,6-bisphosphatase